MRGGEKRGAGGENDGPVVGLGGGRTGLGVVGGAEKKPRGPLAGTSHSARRGGKSRR